MFGLKERLLEFIQHKKISVRAFETSCGFTNAWVSDIMSRIDIGKVQKISEIYPELNIDWLFTGRGSMEYGKGTEQNVPPQTNAVYIANWSDLKDVVVAAIKESKN